MVSHMVARRATSRICFEPCRIQEYQYDFGKVRNGCWYGNRNKIGGGPSIPVHWSPDNKYIVFSRQRANGNGFDNWLLPLFGDQMPRPYLESTFDRIQSRGSPDSRFLAYTTNESGTFQ